LLVAQPQVLGRWGVGALPGERQGDGFGGGHGAPRPGGRTT
jgi:hypothetical protein